MRAWHGTRSLDAARSILRDGFRAGTWFALRPRDSLAFGGSILFEVELDAARLRGVTPASWQFHTLETIPPSAIRSIRIGA